MRLVPRTVGEWLRSVGVVLFVLSFIPPGAQAFLNTPIYAGQGLIRGFSSADARLIAWGCMLMIGWLANFTVFFRLPAFVAIFAVAAPWFVYIAMLFLFVGPGVEAPRVDAWVTTFVPFYPWALGIGLIHGSRIAGPRETEMPRTAWTGY